MNMLELLKINLIFLASSFVLLMFLFDSRGEKAEGKHIRKVLIGGFLAFQAARWLPFAIILLGRPIAA